MNIGGGFATSGNIEIASARRARASEDRIIAFRQQRLHAVDTLATAEIDAQIEDVTALLVQHFFWQAKFGDLRSHHAASLRVLIEHDALIAERRKVAHNGE